MTRFALPFSASVRLVPDLFAASDIAGSASLSNSNSPDPLGRPAKFHAFCLSGCLSWARAVVHPSLLDPNISCLAEATGQAEGAL